MQNTGYLRRRRAGGFTLSEILITLVIIGFIGALGVPMLGQNKLKKPVEVIGRHGTIECFWEGGVVKQFISNNTDNKAGELTDAADGACYFTAPTANLFVLQAVGAGGGGAVGMTGAPSYTNATKDIHGSIPTGTGFLGAINDTKNVPDWVRKEWNKQWTSESQWIEYTLESPIGGSGRAYCEPRRVDWDDGSGYNKCAEYCTTNLAEKCPPECLSNLVADGGNSGYGAKYVVKTKLEYDPEGQQDSVVFNPTYDETTLTIGTKEAKLLASGAGKNGQGNYPYEGVATPGSKGEDIPLTTGSNKYFSLSGMKVYGTPNKTTFQPGGTATEHDCSNMAGSFAKRGSISGGNPGSITFRTQSLAINANYGVAGSPGSAEMRILEKLPAETQFKLVPAQSNSGSNTESTIYIKNKQTGVWEVFMRVSSGADGWGGKEIIAVEEGDLPFPKAYYPDAFRPSTPELSISSGAGYTSYLAKNNFSPGASGAGAHPIVTHVSGNAAHYIGRSDKTLVLTGNESLAPISGASATCYDGSESTTGTCGSGNTSGNPGAVIISW